MAVRRNHCHNPDVVILYQESEVIHEAIKRIQDLDINIHSMKISDSCTDDLIVLEPKVILLSCNNVSNSIKFYAEFLESHARDITPHIAVLLISNKESPRAFIACENGLFDNYAIINPLNEPYRLKLVLQQALKLVESKQNTSINDLIAEGEEELASCIEHGVSLKKSFRQQLDICETKIFTSAREQLDNDEIHLLFQQIVETAMSELNENISFQMQNVLEQLLDVEKINQSIAAKVTPSGADIPQKIENYLHGKSKLPERNAEPEQAKKRKRYRLLIAEHSSLMVQVLKDIFEKTEFDFAVASNGIDALQQFVSFSPDIILLAYGLPKLDGIEVTERIRASGSKLPIIAFSHNKDKVLIKKWVLLGINAYIVKPSSQGVIYKTVRAEVNKIKETLKKQDNSPVEEIEWRPEYSVGNKSMDEQHKKLFLLINEFFHSENKEDVVRIFEQLGLYVQYHFREEEKLLAEMRYPRLVEHSKHHRALIKKFIRLKAKLDDYDIELHHKIAVFMYNWLARHILQSDMDYKLFAMNKRHQSKAVMDFSI
ncbi:bacteriohemerythrin [Thalassomonas sp. RHCl1]|uniref:bacteriohemerythrin n=1 Tax=Thalassomonas sp. RHCl1 TaxID=2995320 RepID=UPI00248B2E61|nr:bacteriohemerythrin [Thalassomonas sp. RHCl1]